MKHNIPTTIMIAVTACALALVACEQNQPEVDEPAAPPSAERTAPDKAPTAADQQPERPGARAQAKPTPRAKPGDQPGQPGQPEGAPEKPSNPSNPAEQAGGDLSNDDLKSFAKAAPQVIEVQRDLQTKIGDAKNPEQADEMQQEARAQVKAELDKADIDPDTYTAIASRLRSDENFQQRFQKVTGSSL